MIPIGKIDHRDRVRATRFVNGLYGTAIPDHIKIAAEGEPIRTLGAWVGNGIEQMGTWSRTLEKIDAALTQWELGHPSMEGRRLIVMMVVGGMTQYMATVQGMPADIEERLERRVRSFLWAEKDQVRVNKETVYAPSDAGGKNLLDIVARNEAIAVTWLKTYLSFGPDRPLWCFVADELLAKKAVGAEYVDEAMRINTYLQSWAPYQSAHDLGSKDLADMMKVGRKYGVRMDAMAVSRKLQDDMPIWYHRFSGGDRRFFNAENHVVKCLKEKHRIRWVRDTRMLARKLGTPRHTNRIDCSCASCRVSREITKCRHPNECYVKAQELLNSLENKWDPRLMQPEDYEEYQTPAQREDPDTAEFDSRITTDGTLADDFRIFTQGYANSADTQGLRGTRAQKWLCIQMALQ
jgi:hypothetical protein